MGTFFFFFFFEYPSLQLSWMFEHDCLDTCCLGVLYASVLYVCICTCSVQSSMFHMERRSRNTLIIIIPVDRLWLHWVLPWKKQMAKQESHLCGDQSSSLGIQKMEKKRKIQSHFVSLQWWGGCMLTLPNKWLWVTDVGVEVQVSTGIESFWSWVFVIFGGIYCQGCSPGFSLSFLAAGNVWKKRMNTALKCGWARFQQLEILSIACLPLCQCLSLSSFFPLFYFEISEHARSAYCFYKSLSTSCSSVSSTKMSGPSANKHRELLRWCYKYRKRACQQQPISSSPPKPKPEAFFPKK